MAQPKAFSLILIDRALTNSDWDLLNPRQVRFEVNTAKEQARGYAENLVAPSGELEA